MKRIPNKKLNDYINGKIEYSNIANYEIPYIEFMPNVVQEKINIDRQQYNRDQKINILLNGI